MREIFHTDSGVAISQNDSDDCLLGNLDATFIGFGKVDWRLS